LMNRESHDRLKTSSDLLMENLLSDKTGNSPSPMQGLEYTLAYQTKSSDRDSK